MTKTQKEQYRLDVRAQAFEDALGEADFAERTGETWRQGLERAAKINRQTATEHRERNPEVV